MNFSGDVIFHFFIIEYIFYEKEIELYSLHVLLEALLKGNY